MHFIPDAERKTNRLSYFLFFKYFVEKRASVAVCILSTRCLFMGILKFLCLQIL